MGKNFLSLLLCFILTACNTSITEPYPNDLELNKVAPYPAAKSGYSRNVIYLPQLQRERDNKVELLIGRETLTDCNSKQLLGLIKKRTISGWGYDYYVVERSGDAISTLKACPSNEKTIQYITITNNIGLINYNSRLPIVVYAPSNLQVRYRVWSIAEETFHAIQQ